MEHVQVILLRRVFRLGIIGDVVKVKPGYARNYLLPKKIALRATKENKELFDKQKSVIEAENAATKVEAQKIADTMKDFSVSLVRQASEKGHLYGSVNCRDIANALRTTPGGIKLTAAQINLNTPIKELGVYNIIVDLHPEVSVNIKLSIAKSEEEAKAQMIDTSEKSSKSAKASIEIIEPVDAADISQMQ